MSNSGIFKERIFKFSILLNVLFLTLLTVYIVRNIDKIRQKLILIKGKPEIIMFGDSHTANASWPSLLRGQDVLGMGFSGFTSDQLKNMMMITVLPFKPKYCFIQGGGNDIKSRCYDKRVLISNIQEMIDTLKKHDIHPVIQSLFYRCKAPEYNAQVDSINLRLLMLSKNENLDFLNVNNNLIDDEGMKREFTIEGIHLNEDGYRVWAKLVNEYLASKSH
jgi:lysophospholipase L1-like esterase